MHLEKLIGLALIQAATLLSQVEPSPLPGWQAVGKVRQGQSVRVLLKRGGTIDGSFESWSATSVSVVPSRASVMSVESTEIKELSVRRNGRRLKAAGMGAGIGFGIGFGIGAASAGYITDRNNPGFGTRTGTGAGIGMFGAGIGAPIGAFVGGPHHKTVYLAR